MVFTRFLFLLLSSVFVLYCCACFPCPWIYFAFVSLVSVYLAHQSSNSSSAGFQYSLSSENLRMFYIGRHNEACPFLQMGKLGEPDGRNDLPKVTQQVRGRASTRTVVQLLNMQHSTGLMLRPRDLVLANGHLHLPAWAAQAQRNAHKPVGASASGTHVRHQMKGMARIPLKCRGEKYLSSEGIGMSLEETLVTRFIP